MRDAVRQIAIRYAHVNWALADQAVVSGANFLTGVLVARYLGIDEFGRFTLLWMVFIFVNSIQDAAICSPMMSIGPKQSASEANAYYGAVIVQQVFFSTAAFLLIFAGAKLSFAIFSEWHVSALAAPLAVTTVVCQFQDFFRRYFFTRGRATTAFAIDVIRYLGQLIILGWLFNSTQHSMDTSKTLWAIALAASTALIVGAICFGKLSIRGLPIGRVAVIHWRSGRWLTASALLYWCTGNLFVVAAGIFLGPVAVGALKATENVMAITHILFQGLQNVVPVRASMHFHAGGKDALSVYLRRVTFYGSAVMLVVAGIASSAPEYWLEIIFGQEFKGYGSLLRGWAVIYVLIFLTLPLRSALRALENTRPIFWASVWATVFSLLAAYPLTKYLGLVGSVVGITTVNGILVASLWFSVRWQMRAKVL